MKSVIAFLSDNRIFNVDELPEDRKMIEFYEKCDEVYGQKLNKNELLQLISELQAIADKMEF